MVFIIIFRPEKKLAKDNPLSDISEQRTGRSCMQNCNLTVTIPHLVKTIFHIPSIRYNLNNYFYSAPIGRFLIRTLSDWMRLC